MAKGKHEAQPKKLDYSKRLIADTRYLLWVVTVGVLFLSAYCIHENYMGALPWLSAMVGLPWTAHGTICSFYLNMAKSDHKEGGITYESAKADNFGTGIDPGVDDTGSINSPSI